MRRISGTLAINCPENDRFQVIHEHTANNFLYPPEYLGIAHGDDLIIIQITLNEGRSTELKKALYKAIAEGIHQRLGLGMNDIFINLVEVKKENWSFGQGIAQYAD
ncbi:MAG: tautomerase family protein [Pseudomonadota bacterium]